MEAKTVAIVDYARSPIAKSKGGSLNKLSSLEICGQVVKQLLARNPKIPGERFESVVCGTAFPEGDNGLNIGRQIVIKAGLPVSVAGMTVNQFCASSQQSTMMIANALALGKGDAGISVGVEHMTRVAMGGFNPWYDKDLYEKNYYIAMGETAEILAREFEISRDAQEEFAMNSHKKALKAWADGASASEVVPITLRDGTTFEIDQCPMEPNPAKMKKLKPAFNAEGTVTAATSSPVSVGVAAIILMSVDAAKELGVPIRATIESTAVVGNDYERMGLGPIPATEKALARAGLAMGDMDVIELNEAFAAQSLAVVKKAGWEKFSDKINVLGGALALGHPLGMSGARIISTALTALERCKGKYALASMCVGGGQGATTILKRWET